MQGGDRRRGTVPCARPPSTGADPAPRDVVRRPWGLWDRSSSLEGARMRLRTPHFLLGTLLCALALAGCGQENPHLLRQSDADRLSNKIDEVAQLVSDGECTEARDAVDEAKQQVTE